MKTRHCDQCIFYEFQIENVCKLDHRPRFYLPRTISDLNCGHKKKCADFVAIEISIVGAAADDCPSCGEKTRLNHGFVCNIETNWRTCFECDWVGEPE